jgi:hypothetical protein
MAKIDASRISSDALADLRAVSRTQADAARELAVLRDADRRVQSLRNSVRDVPAAELQAAIDEAVREVRKEARGAGGVKRGLQLLAKARGQSGRER